MKTIASVCLLGTVLALSACAGGNHSADYSYETAAPYTESRTVGSKEVREEPRVFEQRMRK
ncbi:MAG: hypothetical protein ACK4NR_03435 [Micavibrio sp.]